MTIDIKATIRAAVDILTREADSLRECHTRARDPDDWNGEEDAQAAYDHELATAGALATIPAIVDAQAAEIERLEGRIRYLEHSKDAYRADVMDARRKCEKLSDALNDMLDIYGGNLDSECRRKDDYELERIAKARAALAQEKS